MQWFTYYCCSRNMNAHINRTIFVIRDAMKDQEVLQLAIAALETATGLHAQMADLAEPVALLDIVVGDRAVRFAPTIKTVDRFQTLGTLKAKTDNAQYPPLLVAPHITVETAERCRTLRLPFIDTAGNAYIEAPGLFVFVTGRRRPQRMTTTPAFRALTPAGLKITFALLDHPDLAAAPYREIAQRAKVALGTVGEVLADLEERGHLAPDKPGPRRLLAPELLQEEWVTHYPIKLRPKLNARRFTALDPDGLRNQEIRPYRAYWGGEAAAAKLTGYLKPERITLYVEGKPDKLILALRLRPDDNGEIEILETFWQLDEVRQPDNTVPPLLVYADLMASTDPRNIETAQLIRDHHLAPAHRTA